MLFAAMLVGAAMPFLSAFQSYIFVVCFAYIVFNFAYMIFHHETVKMEQIMLAGGLSIILSASFSSLCRLFDMGLDGRYGMNEADGIFLLVLSCAVAWRADTGAYLTGVFFGKHKLCPHLSPKMSKEGAVGGVLALVAPCAGQDAADDALVQLAPVPNRHGEVGDHAVLLVIQAERARFQMRRAAVAAGDDVHAARGQRRLRAVAGQGGPFQHDLGARVDHLRAEGEGSDRRWRAVDGVIRDVADFVAFRQGGGNRAQDKFGLVHAQVVAAYIVVAGQQRTVEDFGVRVDGTLTAAVTEIQAAEGVKNE